MYITSFDPIHYNQVILYLEKKWQRKLNEHEVAILIEGYRYGRHTEIENKYILESVKCYNNTF